MSTVTAWSAPEFFFRGLYEKLVSLNSPDAMLASFDDEMPNFVGVFGLGPNDYDYDEYLDEEDYEQCIGCVPHYETDDSGNTMKTGGTSSMSGERTSTRVSWKVMQTGLKKRNK